MENRNDSIIKKIKGLLAIANDNKNDEESQSAFMLAQKMMLKHDIDVSEVDTKSSEESIDEGQVTAHKKLFWWEKELADIISGNFRVKYYISDEYQYGHNNVKRAIVFLGLKQDVELAKEMFILSYEALDFYTKRYMLEQKKLKGQNWRLTSSSDLKNSYIYGFLDGMKKKFDEQVKELQKEYGLMVLIPESVEKAYDKLLGNAEIISYKMPSVGQRSAYQKGYSQGNQIDYTKSTIDDDVVM